MSKKFSNEGIKVGDFFYNSWGYDQTNIDYYKVVALVGKSSVKLLPVVSKTVSSNPPAEMVVPGDDEADFDVILTSKKPGDEYPSSWRKGDGPVTKRARDGNVVLGKGYSAWPWGGSPNYETSSGWGH